MSKNINEVIEQLNSILEDELVDDFEMEPIEMEAVEEPAKLSLTDELDAKTKISRALDNLKKAIDDFKNATITEVNLVQDADIIKATEELTNVCGTIETALSGKHDKNEIENIEEPEKEEVIVQPEESVVELVIDSEETDEEQEAEDSEESNDYEMISFEDEAEFDIFQ